MAGSSEKIYSQVCPWPGVVASPHRFGGTEYRVGKREIGHVHGNVLVDIPFPMHIRNELIATQRAEPHHILPNSGWVSVHLRSESDVDNAIRLLRMSYERIIELTHRPRGRIRGQNLMSVHSQKDYRESKIKREL